MVRPPYCLFPFREIVPHSVCDGIAGASWSCLIEWMRDSVALPMELAQALGYLVTHVTDPGQYVTRAAPHSELISGRLTDAAFGPQYATVALALLRYSSEATGGRRRILSGRDLARFLARLAQYTDGAMFRASSGEVALLAGLARSLATVPETNDLLVALLRYA